MITLCQDCLRVIDVSIEKLIETNGAGLCGCGGEVCHCESCISTIEKLEKGVLEKDFIGISVAIESWSPVTGAVCASNA